MKGGGWSKDGAIKAKSTQMRNIKQLHIKRKGRLRVGVGFSNGKLILKEKSIHKGTNTVMT